MRIIERGNRVPVPPNNFPTIQSLKLGNVMHLHPGALR